MILGVISDTHDNFRGLAAANPHLADCAAIIHCGDLCSPFIVGQLSRDFSQPVHVVWGNNEGDILLMTRIASEYKHLHFHGELAELDFDGVKVAVNHYPRIARRLAESGAYQLVCYGHDHKANFERVGLADLLNPGDVLGLNGRASVARYNTETRQAEHITLDLTG